ncbi:OmpA family protein [Dyella sp. EPa41]|uniref:OmpA family protein n=1 Tax=Dyella sp. EPa41 TaxID=1561194 RepID=UPI00191622AA|nr:OmpA family protein [Dyella sp. EPa41]
MRKTWKHISVAVSAAFVLAACGNVSRDVARDGHSAGELVWPTPDSATPMHKGGTFPNLANLRQMRAGLNKPQVSDLIGYPHFSEGLWGVREWNYVFNFHKPGGDEVTVCQYKVLFDQGQLARSFYWKPESCADVLKEPVASTPALATSSRRVFSGDALFAFDSADLSAGGRQALDALADELKGQGEVSRKVRIAGYTDRLGSHTYNQQLSDRRAQAVKDYLVARGTTGSLITARGYGEADPVKDCRDGQREALIACLAPNRRVEVFLE